MARKYLSNFIFFLVALSPLSTFTAAAEVACVSDVSYRWIKEQLGQVSVESPAESQQSSGGEKGEQPGQAAPSAAGAGGGDDTSHAGGRPQALNPGEQRVRFATIERRGKDERGAKAGLLIEVNRQKSRAYERCKRDHESFGGCVSTKLSTKTTVLNSLSFSARSKVEEALIEECRVQQGRCVAIESSEPVCRPLGGSVVAGSAVTPVEGDAVAKDGEAQDSAAAPSGEKAGGPAVEKSDATKKNPQEK